jgi:predicted Zn-dependent peptidase
MSSRLWLEVRAKRGLAYSIHTDVERYQEIGYLSTYAGVDIKHADEALKIMLDEVYKLVNGTAPIAKKELSKAKEYLKGNLALALEDTKDVTAFFADQTMFSTEILTPEDVYKKLDKVSIDDIMSEAKKFFIPSRLNLAIIGPFKSEEKFVQLLQ